MTQLTGTLKRAARRAAKKNGHSLDNWSIEAGRPVAACACGGYVAIEGKDWATGRIKGQFADFITNPCRWPAWAAAGRAVQS